MAKKCGNPECSCSTGIHGGLTFGSGELDHNGYWEYPCRECAEHCDDTAWEVIQEIRQEILDNLHPVVASRCSELIDWQIRIDHEWLFIPAFPPDDFDYKEHRKCFQEYKEEQDKKDREFDEMFPGIFGEAV
jgi:hypothetical protein